MAEPKIYDPGSHNRPKPALYNSVCFSYRDLGMQKSKFNPAGQPKIALGFEINFKIDDPENPLHGMNFALWKDFHWTWAPKSILTKNIRSWLSKYPTFTEQRAGIDMEAMCVGVRCTLNLVENGDFINIESILAPHETNNIVANRNMQSDIPNYLKLRMIEGGTMQAPDVQPGLPQSEPTPQFEAAASIFQTQAPVDIPVQAKAKEEFDTNKLPF